MNYYRVMNNLGTEVRLILANSGYEAIGYYLLETENSCRYIEDVFAQKMDSNEEIKITHNGSPIYIKIKEFCLDKKFNSIPCVISDLTE